MKKLKSASVDITYDCNFRCLHCFNSSGEQGIKRPYLTDEEIVTVVKQIAELEPDSICMCGGETMLRKDVIYKVLDARNNGEMKKVAINCVSNGFLINEEVAKTLGEKKIDHVQISLDGASKETHEWLRNMPGSFDKAINAIKLLVAQGILVGVAFTPTKKNIHELSDAIALADSLGVRRFRVQPTMSLGRANKYLKDYMLDDAGYMKVKYVLDQNRKKYKRADFIEWGDPIDHLHIGQYLDTIVAIGAYGDIVPSPYLPISVGNIKKHSFPEYLEKGVLKVWLENEFLNAAGQRLQDFAHMDTKEMGLPSIFTEEYITMDVCDENYKEYTKELMKKYNFE